MVNDSLPPSAEGAGWLRNASPLLVSAACHLAALIGLALLTAASGDAGGGIRLLADMLAGLEAPADDSAPDSVTLETGPQLADEWLRPEALPLDEEAAAALADLLSPAEAADMALFSGGAGQADSPAHAAHSARLSPADTRFFGIDGSGDTFVYVVDSSSSMREQGKFQRACAEVLYSIQQLDAEQRYFVIFFSSTAYPMDAEGPVAATNEEIAQTRRWIETLEPIGGTNPLPALLVAIALRPDAIFFLSDGRFDPTTHRHLQRQFGRRRLPVPIHSIAFVNRETEVQMRTIARLSGGQYRFVR